MDYDGRQVRWYWIFLFLLYSGAVIMLLFNGNPYLYSHHELRAAMDRGAGMSFATIPAQPQGPEKSGAATFFQRFNFGRSGVDPTGTPRSRSYVEFEQHRVELGIEGFEAQNISHDNSGFFLTGRGPWVVSVGLDGQLRWKFRFTDVKGDRELPPVLLDDTTAYILHPDGEALALNKMDGSIRWLAHLDRELAADPFLWQNRLVVPVKDTKGVQWVMLNRGNGRAAGEPVQLDLKPGFLVSQGQGAKSLVVTWENKVALISTDDWKIGWTQSFTDPVKGPAVVVDHQIFVSTLGSKVVKLDATKKGKVEWEAELDKPPVSAPSFVPIANRISVMLEGGVVSLLDGKTGKELWTYNSLNKSPLEDTWSVRLSAKNIEDYKMDWLHKGWTVWSACSNRHFCIYTPNKGQLIASVPLSTLPRGLPLHLDKRIVFFGTNSSGQYQISHLVEEAEAKKLKAEVKSEANPGG